MMPDALPGSGWSLVALVLMLGLRHGFDADHLAAIDSLARLNRPTGSRLAGAAGVLFSVGHGLVIVPISVCAAVMARQFALPQWIETFGVWTSICLLGLLAVLNIRAALYTPASEAVALTGWRTSLLRPLLRTVGGWSPLLVGALFALSFDTISQAMLFALLSSRFGGWHAAVGLSLLFVVGMLITDGLNGWWLAALLRRADRRGRIASRVMALTVGGIALATAGVGIASQFEPHLDTWFAGVEPPWGAATIVAVGLGFAIAMRRGRRQPAATAQPRLE